MGKSKIITYVVVAVLVLLGLYWIYGMVNKAPAETAEGVVAVSTVGSNVSAQSGQASQFVEILNDIDNIDLQNRLILSNKIFTSLRDYGKTIEDRPTGRANPFASFVGGEGAGTTKAASSTAPKASSTPVQTQTNFDDLITQ